jgi:hypothetical protein
MFLGYLMTRRVSYLSGMITSFLYAILPYSIFYGRVVLPDPFMVFLSIGSIVFLDVFTEKKSYGWFILSILLGMCGLLVKPVAAFLLLPIPYMLLMQKKPFLQKCLECIVWGGVVIAPLLWWRQWILQFPEGIPASDWLFNKNNIRFKGAWFQWLFADRIGRLILGYWGLIPFGIGMIIKPEKREGILSWLLMIGSLAYLAIIAGGNVQHDYYQILLLPVITMFAGKGMAYLFTNTSLQRVSAWGVGIVSILFTCAFSWYTLRSYYWINRPEIIEAGRKADALIPADAKVIASYNGDTTFLYQTNRSGWPLGFDIEKKIEMGATHYVTVSPTDNDLETKDLSERYTVLVKNDTFAIIDLTKKRE